MITETVRAFEAIDLETADAQGAPFVVWTDPSAWALARDRNLCVAHIEVLKISGTGATVTLLAEDSSAMLTARDQAFQDHQRLVALEAQDASDEGAAPHELNALARVHAEPREGEWRVDPEDYVQRALAALAPPPDPVPMTRADLDPHVHFSGFTAAQGMRSDPELGNRALHLDEAAAEILVAHLGMDKETAAQEARLLTDMFWLALRRALQAGSHQLATSIRFVAGAAEDPVQAQFTRELLRSWLHALETLPEPKRSLAQRLLGQGLRGQGNAKKTPAITASAPKQLTAAGPGEAQEAVPKKVGLWQRLRGKSGDEEET